VLAQEIADDLRVSRAQLALAWAAATPGVSSVITGATQLDQLKENLGALKVKVNDDIKVSLEKLFRYE
jgi:aryl-alcohol dehydrogenase-like predicted oxidoreductase